MVSEVIHTDYHAALRAVAVKGNGHLAGIVRMECAREKPQYRLGGICAVVEQQGSKITMHDLFFYGSQADICKTVGYMPSFRGVKAAPREAAFPWLCLSRQLTFDGTNYCVPMQRLPLHNGKKAILPVMIESVTTALPAMFDDAELVAGESLMRRISKFGCFPPSLVRTALLARSYVQARLDDRLHVLVNGAYDEEAFFVPRVRLQSPVRGDGYHGR